MVVGMFRRVMSIIVRVLSATIVEMFFWIALQSNKWKA
jgi:hypothetical protein